MNEGPVRKGFATRPVDPEQWIKVADHANSASITSAEPSGFTARLTIDVTPDLRGRIKITAFKRGITVADMLRDLLSREFPIAEGDEP